MGMKVMIQGVDPVCLDAPTQWAQVLIYYKHRPKSKDIGTALSPRYTPYGYMDPLGKDLQDFGGLGLRILGVQV